MQLHDRAKDGQDRLYIMEGRGKRGLMDVVHEGQRYSCFLAWQPTETWNL